MSAAEKARNDSLRTLPSAPRPKLSDMAADSSGASTIVTEAYPPCVHKQSFAAPPDNAMLIGLSTFRSGQLRRNPRRPGFPRAEAVGSGPSVGGVDRDHLDLRSQLDIAVRGQRLSDVSAIRPPHYYPRLRGRR